MKKLAKGSLSHYFFQLTKVWKYWTQNSRRHLEESHLCDLDLSSCLSRTPSTVLWAQERERCLSRSRLQERHRSKFILLETYVITLLCTLIRETKIDYQFSSIIYLIWFCQIIRAVWVDIEIALSLFCLDRGCLNTHV